MDLLRIGRSLRALRIRRGLRQVDVVNAAGMSASQVARIERGESLRLPIGDFVRVGGALGADLDVRVRWRGEALDRLLDEAHAAIVERIVRWLAEHGWVAAVEVTYNLDGERGAVDILGWHEATATILVVEVKSVVPDLQAMLAAHDRKRRLAARIARSQAWAPRQVARLLVLPEGSVSRRRVAVHAGVFERAYPFRGLEVRRWLREPAGVMSGLVFFPIYPGATIRRSPGGRKRVRARG